MTEAATIKGEHLQREHVQRRTLLVVVVSQVLGGAGLAAGVTVGALLAQQMLGADSLTGLPTAAFTLGSALAAYLIGRITQQAGRRPGLGFGFIAGGVGAFGVVYAAISDSAVLLFISLFVYGAGSATNLQARYAGTDLALPSHRGRAISMAMVATTLGAVAGPNLVEPLGGLASAIGVPALGGPFLLAGAAYLAAGTALLVLLRPDPFLLARKLEAAGAQTPTSDASTKRNTARIKPRPGAYAGGAVMVLTQISMVAVMTMTPVHMRAHHHSLGEVGIVIGVHIGAMYLPSLVTGILVDKIGRVPMAVASGATLACAGISAALAPADSLGFLILALALLGLGWNFGLISGTALIVDNTVLENRARTQGALDVLIALAGAGAGALSGVVTTGTSYATLALLGGAMAFALIPVLIWAIREERRWAGKDSPQFSPSS